MCAFLSVWARRDQETTRMPTYARRYAIVSLQFWQEEAGAKRLVSCRR